MVHHLAAVERAHALGQISELVCLVQTDQTVRDACTPPRKLACTQATRARASRWQRRNAEVEQAETGIDGCLPHVGELLALSRQPNNKKDGMGGLDKYLTTCFCRTPPQNIRSAMQRLGIALKSIVQVRSCASGLVH